MNEDTIDMLRRASAYIQATVTTDPETGDPVTDCDIAANDLACELACEADRLDRLHRAPINTTAAWPFPPERTNGCLFVDEPARSAA